MSLLFNLDGYGLRLVYPVPIQKNTGTGWCSYKNKKILIVSHFYHPTQPTQLTWIIQTYTCKSPSSAFFRFSRS